MPRDHIVGSSVARRKAACGITVLPDTHQTNRQGRKFGQAESHLFGCLAGSREWQAHKKKALLNHRPAGLSIGEIAI